MYMSCVLLCVFSVIIYIFLYVNKENILKALAETFSVIILNVPFLLTTKKKKKKKTKKQKNEC